jgi:hypothetical protein
MLAWELGLGLGHVYPLRALADELVLRGHEVYIAGRSLLRVRQAFADALREKNDPRMRVLAAPYFPTVMLPAAQQSSLADVIWYDAGGHSAAILGSLFNAWRELLGQLRIDLLVADGAPIALAAAQGVCPALSYGGYFHATDPAGWGIFRDWERIDRNACTQRAERLLAHLDLARAGAGLPPADSLFHGFGASTQLIRFLPELDYAAPRAGVSYVDQLNRGGLEPQWPQPTASRRLFVYLRKDYLYFERLIAALAALDDCAVLCFHDGVPAAKLRTAAHLSYSTSPFDMRQVLAQTDAVVCHGAGLQAQAARAGKALLCLPMQTEQFLSARLAVRLGVGLLHAVSEPPPSFSPLLRKLLGDAGIATRARARELGALAHAREPDAVATVAAACDRLVRMH